MRDGLISILGTPIRVNRNLNLETTTCGWLTDCFNDTGATVYVSQIYDMYYNIRGYGNISSKHDPLLATDWLVDLSGQGLPCPESLVPWVFHQQGILLASTVTILTMGSYQIEDILIVSGITVSYPDVWSYLNANENIPNFEYFFTHMACKVEICNVTYIRCELCWLIMLYTQTARWTLFILSFVGHIRPLV